MTLLAPIGLLALIALPVIVLLHVVRARRRRVAVASLQLWAGVQPAKRGTLARRLRFTPLLLLQLLAAAALAFALTRPQVAGLGEPRPDQIAIVVDTSLSMAATNGAGVRLDLARDQARELLRLAPQRAVLLSAGPQARIVAAGAGGDPQLLSGLAALRPAGVGADIDAALTLAVAALDPQRSAEIVVLTDGANTTLQPRTLSVPVVWRQIVSGDGNRAIVAFGARPGPGGFQVYARVANYAGAAFAAPLTLRGDDGVIETRNIALAPEGETELTWRVPSGPQTLTLTLDGRDPLPQDDTALLSLVTARPTAVTLVSGQPDALQKALGVLPGVTVTVVQPDRYAPDRADLTVFDSTLPTAWPVGAALVINPPGGSQLLPAQVQSVAATAPISATGSAARSVISSGLLGGLDLSGVSFGPQRRVPLNLAGLTPLALERNGESGGTPLVLRGQLSGHELMVWTFDLHASNLAGRLAFPVLVSRAVRDLTPNVGPAAAQAGQPLTLRPDPRAAKIALTGLDGKETALAPAPLLTLDGLSQPGWYTLTERDASGATIYANRLAVNGGSSAESDLRPRPAPELSVAALAPEIAPSRGGELWTWIAALALLLLLAEWAYAHRKDGRTAPQRT